MIKVGVTGGIGCGKSLVCQIFSRLGAPVYNSDQVAREIIETDPDVRNSLIRLMGEEIFTGRSLNRKVVSAIIFSDKPLLQKVNTIIHPRVAEHFMVWCGKQFSQPYVIQESALLFETGAYVMFDKCITISAPEELRIKRVVSRQEMTVEKVKLIMQNQLPEKEKIIGSHHVIINDEVIPLLPQVLRLHREFT